MSILAYVGLPGSGKSYDVVANQVLPALKGDRTVVTNIPLHEDRIRETIKTGRLIDFPTEKVQSEPASIWDYAQPGVVLILDEVWRLFPMGEKANKVPEPFRKLLAEHRHMVDAKGDSMQIVLVTQDLMQIGTFARQLVEQTVYHTKLSAVGASKSYRIDIYQGPVTGANPPKSNRVREIFGKYQDSVTRLYQSHTMSQSEEGKVNESAADNRGVIWRRPGIWIGLVGVVVMFAWGIPTAISLIRMDKYKDEQATPQPEASPEPQSTISPIVAAIEQPAAQQVPLSCVQHVIDGNVQCRCLNAVGKSAFRTTFQCIDHMRETVGNFGGPTARAENIQYLNSTRNEVAQPAG